MLKVTAIVSMVGGTGKTSLSLALGTTLVAQGYPTCIVDLDFGGSQMADVVVPECMIFSNHVVSAMRGAIPRRRELAVESLSIVRGVRLLPADPSLFGRWNILREEGLAGTADWVRTILELSGVLEDQGIEHVILDAPPGYTWLADSAIYAATGHNIRTGHGNTICCTRNSIAEADYLCFMTYHEQAKHSTWCPVLALGYNEQSGRVDRVVSEVGVNISERDVGVKSVQYSLEVAKTPVIAFYSVEAQGSDRALGMIAKWTRAYRDPKKPRSWPYAET